MDTGTEIRARARACKTKPLQIGLDELDGIGLTGQFGRGHLRDLQKVPVVHVVPGVLGQEKKFNIFVLKSSIY